MAGWWMGKTRQFWRHLTGRVGRSERAQLGTWLTPAQMQLFESMHRADQRHGLDVVRTLGRAGHDDRDLLLAGLLHDCGKGHAVGVWHRVAWSLGERYGRRVIAVARRLPGFSAAFATIAEHPQRSAEMAVAAGCSRRTAELIRGQSSDPETELDTALQLADQAN